MLMQQGLTDSGAITPVVPVDVLQRFMLERDTGFGRLHFLGPVIRYSATVSNWDLPPVPLGILANPNKFWNAVTIDHHPFLQADNQSWLSMFGNPNYWKPRTDFFSSSNWNSLNDIAPVRKTLTELIDFERLNNAELIRA